MQPVETIKIAAAGIKAEVAPLGAELVCLQDEAGRDLLWNGDPSFWTGRAPLLFPVVGRLKGDHLNVDGTAFPMRQHGFARQSTFEIVSREASACRLRLTSNEATRRIFPFDFVLEVLYDLTPRTLSIGTLVKNSGSRTLPVSMGYHPALRWPLPYGASRAAHEIVFDQDEPEPIRQLDQGLTLPAPKPTPVVGRTLALSDDLFADDALVFDRLASRGLRYGPPDGRAVHVRFPAMPHLGIWTKPGAGFLCIEPWQGYASPDSFDGDFSQKPGLVSIEPGAERHFGMTIALDPP